MLRTHIKFGWPAILYGKDTEIFQQASEGLDAKELGENYLDNWRRRGPIAKLHNFVLWVRSSPQRSQMFKGIFVEDLESDSDQDTAAVSTTALQLILNNATRYVSVQLAKPVFGIQMAFLRDLVVRISIEIVSCKEGCNRIAFAERPLDGKDKSSSIVKDELQHSS
ncbi:hypothetical protein E4U44_007231 [Claviceps purpurea]|nr:hypothetical protein E4U44_007231 [Claviceps purpurea]